ncbi:MAG: hypothetical protein WCK27_01040 [Verrucomicrobiota bacterium]
MRTNEIVAANKYRRRIEYSPPRVTWGIGQQGAQKQPAEHNLLINGRDYCNHGIRRRSKWRHGKMKHQRQNDSDREDRTQKRTCSNPVPSASQPTPNENGAKLSRFLPDKEHKRHECQECQSQIEKCIAARSSLSHKLVHRQIQNYP